MFTVRRLAPFVGEVTEQMEEYLETIYRIEADGEVARTGAIADHLGVGAPSVTDMLQRLERAGFVVYEPYRGVQLTDEGRAIGRRQLEKHRVMQAFLQEVVGMPHATAHEAACAMEHTIPPELDAWMASFLEERLGHPFDVERKVKEQIEG